MSTEPWGRVRRATMLRLADAQSVRPVMTGRAFASIICRARPYANLREEDAGKVREWSEAGENRIPLDDYEVAAVSNATIAEEGFDGDKRNARKGIAHLVESGVVDRVSQGTRGHASLYVTYPTRADVAEGAYPVNGHPIRENPNRAYGTVPPIVENIVENPNRAYDSVRPIGIVENPKRAYDRAEKGVRQEQIGRTGVPSDQGLPKHHQSTTDNNNRAGRSVAAAAGAAPPARKTQPRCTLCGGKLFRNSQTGKYDCGTCCTSYSPAKLEEIQGTERR